MAKPLQVVGWGFQLIGLVLVYYTFFGDFSHIRINIIYGLLAFAFIAYGRSVYVPEVRLLQQCPKCSREIKLTNRECPYCHAALEGNSRFPGIGDDNA